MVTPRFNRPGPAVALLASMTAALFASSCGWLTGDIFPAWAPFVDGRADLAAVADAADVGKIRDLSTVEYAPMKDSTDADASKVLVYIQGLDGEALAALEPDGLGLAQTWKRSAISSEALFNLGPRIITEPGGFIAGRTSFVAADLDAEPQTVAAALPDTRILAFGDPASYFTMNVWFDTISSVNYFYISRYDDISIAAPIPAMSADRTLDIAAVATRLLDAGYFPGAGADPGELRILVETGYGAYAFSFAYDDAAILGAADAVITGPLPVNDGRGWLTADGVVTLYRSDDTTLARYAYGATGAADVAATPLDTLTFNGDTEDFNVASFSADGDRWYLYDGLRKLLYAMRTWW